MDHRFTKRTKIFIRLMLAETLYRPLTYYAEKMRVSSKTLQLTLKDAKEYLKQYELSVYASPGKGILLDKRAGNCLALLNDLNEIASETEISRKNAILKRLLYSNEKTSVQKLADEYYVSKTSIVSDLHEIEKWLKWYNLELKKTRLGTYISGSEVHIRKAIAGYTFLENTRSGLTELFRREDIDFVEEVLREVEADVSDIGDVYYVNLLTHILICVNRILQNKGVEKDARSCVIDTDTIRQYQNAECITKKIGAHYHINIGKEETYYIYQYLISSRMTVELPKAEEEKELSRCLANELTEKLSQKLGIALMQEHDLIENLILHIRPMLNRLEYKIHLHNPLKEEIYRQYPEMVKECRDILKELEEKYHLNHMEEDEMISIVIYYQTILEKLAFKKKVLLVCHSGYGTSELLKAKLQNEFAFLEITDVVSSRKAEEINLDGVDCIISTVPIKRNDIPHIVVSALLTRQDIQTIRKHLLHLSADNKEG